MFFIFLSHLGLRGAPGYSLDQAHHLPIEMDPLIGMSRYKCRNIFENGTFKNC